jgi:hypothetical protein
MFRDQKLNIFLGIILAAGSLSADAAVSAAEAAKLGKELTPMGSEHGANANGSIPVWTGGTNFTDEQKKLTLTQLKELFAEARKIPKEDFPKMYDEATAKGEIPVPPAMKEMYEASRDKIGDNYKPLFTITAANMAQYADKLSEGQKAMLKAYPTYKITVYPSVRTAFFPDAINAATLKNATSAKLEGTESVLGAELGFPFPIPKNGAEVMWNSKLKFRGTAVRRFNDQAIVKPDGDFKITKLIEDVKFKYANLKERAGPGNRIFAYYIAKTVAPPRVAGQIYLVHEPFAGMRVAWIYNPGLARINRAPDVGYDNPSVGTDGEQFNDQVDMFNGALDRYDWKLVGKKEMYIPYNAYTMSIPILSYKEMLRAHHVNPKYTRHELHRVWVVDATLKSGLRHAFKRRTFYLDEDSWSIAGVDCYDNRDQLWKYQEGHLITAPFIPTTTAIPEVIHDLQSKRYFTTAMINEADNIVDFEINYEDSHFDPANFKRLIR